MRTPRQLVLRSRNCNDARHSAGHSTASTSKGSHASAGAKFDRAQYVTPNSTMSK